MTEYVGRWPRVRGGGGAREWTLAEIALLEEGIFRPVTTPIVEIAKKLGLNNGTAVSRIRARMRNGTFRLPYFSEAELIWIADTRKSLTFQQQLEQLRCSRPDVTFDDVKGANQLALHRGSEIDHSKGANKNPNQVGTRTLLAKTCSKCELFLPADEFSRSISHINGKPYYDSYCGRCARRASRENHLNNGAERRAYGRQHHQDNREAILARGRQYKEKNKEYLQRRYKRHREQMIKDIPNPRNHLEWTAAEDDTVMRDDIFLIEMCYLLGRSYDSVSSRRSVLRERGLMD